jgi:hypothetical protein
MITFKEFYSELFAAENEKKLLLEYECYRLIPGTRNSFREDPMKTSTKTEKHSHVYARPKGGGKELYAVNLGGSGHDGSSGKEIPKAHADYFRSKGYNIPTDNILECINIEDLVGTGLQILFG